MVEYAKILSNVSVIIAGVFLFASSFFLDDYREANETCSKLPGDRLEPCKGVQYFVVGASFGIIASLIQLLTFVISHLEKWKIWCIIHLCIFVLVVIAFSVPMSKDSGGYYGGPCNKRTAKFFLSLAGIDMIFTLAAPFVVYFLNK